MGPANAAPAGPATPALAPFPTDEHKAARHIQGNMQYLTVRWHDYRIPTYLIRALWVRVTYLLTNSVIRSCDSLDWSIQTCYWSASSRVTETFFLTCPCGTCFKIYSTTENIIIVSLNTVIPNIVIVKLGKVTWCLHKRIIYSHPVLATFLM